MMSDENTKVCRKCQQVLNRDSFGRDKNRPDGLFPYCRRCRLRDADRYDFTQKMKAEGLFHCGDCDQWLPLTGFYPNAGDPQGRSSQCRECSKERVRAWQEANPDKVREKEVRRWQERREERQTSFRLWYQKNTEQQKAKSRQWHKENYQEVRIKRLLYLREWTAKNGRVWYKRYAATPNGRACFARARHIRRAREKASPATLTAEQWVLILELQHNQCACCKRTFTESLPATRDHILPLSHGGGLTFENAQALCRSCNSSKNAKHIDYREGK